MNTLMTEAAEPRAACVRVTKDALVVDLDDGRTVLAPVAWYPEDTSPPHRDLTTAHPLAMGAVFTRQP
ncbi:MAG: hypothetical protein ABSA52_22685 [Candidatus Binatia bacterium]|jgi:hypothetical protein